MVLKAVRTTRGREKTVLSSIEARMDNDPFEIKAIFYPEDLKGYLFIEGEETDIEDLIDGVRHVKGTIEKEADIEDLEEFLSDEPQEIKLEEGDKVEVIGGPYKGERAEIERIDDSNQEATIKLLEAAVPIPVTLSVELLRKRSEK
ncbi:MAG: transcription elongation factor Spt5 [Candidatus Nanohaloarchaea archaeon]|nr:transcription elongation factor Spt5 [Candidatus Nanohaloarchaea archaeon]